MHLNGVPGWIPSAVAGFLIGLLMQPATISYSGLNGVRCPETQAAATSKRNIDGKSVFVFIPVVSKPTLPLAWGSLEAF